jgi:hypothetical protein
MYCPFLSFLIFSGVHTSEPAQSEEGLFFGEEQKFMTAIPFYLDSNRVSVAVRCGYRYSSKTGRIPGGTLGQFRVHT